jgi:signal transduction histidine kinase
VAIQQTRLQAQIQKHAAELEQRVAERTTQLQAAVSEMEAFTYSMSHDLRAPLRAMQGFAEALLADYADRLDQTGQDYTLRISAAAHRLDLLIQDLLAYSRLSRAELHLKPVNLTAVLHEALAQLEMEIKTRQAEVTLVEPLPQILGHQATLLQIVTNLLSNAVKFVPPGATPRVRVWAETRVNEDSEALPWVRVWVEDNGIGIALEHSERIFRVFERLHGAEVYPGTGIGLALVRKGIERMGGRVGFESVPGVGSRFWVELPQVRNSG